jgi:hypothetical protein
MLHRHYCSASGQNADTSVSFLDANAQVSNSLLQDARLSSKVGSTFLNILSLDQLQ